LLQLADLAGIDLTVDAPYSLLPSDQTIRPLK
jgi:hypothetical protein